jgi:hypothetical protein
VGRAALDLIEAAGAFDVAVTSITLDPCLGDTTTRVSVLIEFLDRRSARSKPVDVQEESKPQSLSFAASEYPRLSSSPPFPIYLLTNKLLTFSNPNPISYAYSKIRPSPTSFSSCSRRRSLTARS